jgi:ATP-dependent helicase/nuclease subunit B
MLQIAPYENRRQIAQVFETFNPRAQTWLVSDLRTKFELQQKILKREGQYIDESVLRASDLWKTLLKRVDPSLRLVSESFARSLLRTIVDENKEILQINSTATDTLFSYINQLAPIIFHSDGRAQLEQWFNSHSESSNRWRDWFNRAFICSQLLLKQYKVITGSWITAHLQQFDNFEYLWKVPLIVDLGGEFTRVEAELIRILSRTVDVVILEPSPHWRKDFQFLLQPYEDLRHHGTIMNLNDTSASKDRKREVLRFSGMLAEVKNSVGQVRKWLEQGVSAEQISVIAPDIEVYWPVLESYFAQEGIPVKKDITHKVQSLPSVTRWLASLRARGGGLSSSDLEISFYQGESSQKMRYEEFRALFKSLYVDEDLARSELVYSTFYNQIEKNSVLFRDEFIGQALKYWKSSETEIVQMILREILQNASALNKMKWAEWLAYLETVTSSKEYCISKANSQGITVTKLMSAHQEGVKFRVFIGLAEEAIRKHNKTQLSGQDYFELGKDLGFYLDNPEQTDLDFELRMLAQQESQHDVLSFGATDFTGDLCSPSKFWISFEEKKEELCSPMETRWDEIQHTDLLNLRPWIKEYQTELNRRINQDLGKEQLENLCMSKLPSMSISAIETFLECPFIFAAQRAFKLKDYPEIDLDVDHRTRGQLAHALFENLTIEPMRFDWTEKELSEILETIRKIKKIVFADERLWLPLKKRHLQLAKRFLEIEKSWREEFRSCKTLAREKKFEFYLDPDSGSLTREPLSNGFRVSGQIDRIDCDGRGHLVVLDYKSSYNGIVSHGSWLEKSDLQLLFYMWIIEKSLVEEVDGQVIGLFYYIFKDFQKKGFRINELAGALYPPASKRDKNTTWEDKERYLSDLIQTVMVTLSRIKNGECAPQPANEKTCKKCDWRRLCRAPHLN